MDMDKPEALADIRILDLSGPAAFYCTKLLADLGADVVRVESANDQYANLLGPFIGDEAIPDRSLYRFHFHTNKRSIALDVTTSTGRDVLHRLLLTADVLVDTFQSNEALALGLDPATLRKNYPSIVHTSINGFGPEGPYRDYKVTDLIGMAVGGLMAITGFPEDPPNQLGAEQAYHMASLHAAVGTLLALAQRDLDGTGRDVQIAIQDAVSISTLQTANLNIYTQHGIVPKRSGDAYQPHGVPVPLGPSVKRCKDGWFTITIPASPASRWDKFVAWLDSYGMAEELTDPKFRDFAIRSQEGERVAEIQGKFFAQYTRQELFHEAQKHDQLCMPVQTVVDLLNDEQLHARNFFIEVNHPELGQTFTYPGAPYKLSKTPFRIKRRAPVIGEDGVEILCDWLGVPVAEAEDLLKERVSAPKPRVPQPNLSLRGGTVAKEHCPSELPLSGLRVADFCWAIAGPLGTRVLAHFGAEVIKIESMARPDVIRIGGPRPVGNDSVNVAGVFNDCNTSKMSLALDLSNTKAIEIVKSLISTSDIVTNNFSGEQMGRWGLDYEDLIKIKPDIIMLSMPVMGTTGPHRSYVGYGNHISAGAGINGITGFPNRAPVGTGALYPDFAANPYHAVFAILAALRYRERTGKGQFIDLAQYESTMALLGTSFLEYTMLGRVPARPGNRSAAAAPHGVYRCAGDDRWCAIAVTTDPEWDGLCHAMGNQEWASYERFQTLAGRKGHEDELDRLVEEWTVRYPAQEVMARLQHNGVPAGVVQNTRDLLESDSIFRERHIRFIDHPEAATMAVHGETIRISGIEPRIERAPLMMEHSDHILKNILGMDDSEITQLHMEQVLQ